MPQSVLDDLNARVARYHRTPDAENAMRSDYQPNGNLKIPVLALHTRWDPIVPLFNEDRYRDMVAQAGCSDMLKQETVDRFGHCTYTPDQLVAAFDELVAWVNAPAP